MSYFRKIAVAGVQYDIALPYYETDYIQQKIWQEETPYELGLLQDMAGRLETGDLVLDIGANIGNHSLFLAAVAQCQVHAFEPNAALCDALNESVRRNGFSSRVTVHRVGVGSEPGKARFANISDSNLGGQSLTFEGADPGEIEVIPLDDLSFEKPIRAMKIDVEGMELAVLKGAAELIARDHPSLYVECQAEEDFDAIQSWLAPYGYSYWETFNATPTHLFVQTGNVSDTQRTDLLIAKAVREKYRLEQQVRTLRSNLDQANGKYRSVSQQVTTLKEQLQSANLKHEDAQENIVLLMREADALREDLCQKTEDLQRLTRRIAKDNQPLLKSQLHAASLKYRAVSSELALIRRSRAFRAAKYIGEARKSWKAAVKLPWRLFKLARHPLNQSMAAISSTPMRHTSELIVKQSKPLEMSSKARLDAFRKQLQNAADRRLRVACIMDAFTYQSLLPECDLHPLTPDGWENELKNAKPDMLLVESAWRGKDEKWGSKVGQASEELRGIIHWCQEQNVPTAFWNKEDPVHFQTFLTTANMFEFVFTTDMDCIHRYKGALGHDRVYLLPFACQPQVNNPIEKYERKNAFCFAGAYYARYPERTRDLHSFVKHLPVYRPLEIYDRNHGKDHPDYQFPDTYRPYIIGSLPFEEIDKAYKNYRYAINLNSIKHSQTMFARRVYELLASNTVTVSNYSRGVRLLFGDLVVTSDDGSELTRRLEAIAGDDVALRKFRLAGMRKVMREHTYADRFAYIVSKLKSEGMPDPLPHVLVVGYVRSKEEMDALIAHFQRQVYANKRLVLVASDGLRDETEPREASLHIIRETEATLMSLSDGLLSSEQQTVEWLAGMVAEDYYGPNYLTDLALASRYSSAEAIGKVAHYAWNEETGLQPASPEAEYRLASQAAHRAALVRPSRLSPYSLAEFAGGLREGSLRDISVLGIDGFNYCLNGMGTGAELGQIQKAVDDLPGLYEGTPLAQILARAESIEPEQRGEAPGKTLSGSDLARLFKPIRGKPYNLTISQQVWEVDSSLPDGTHEYIYAAQDVTPEELGYSETATFYLDVEPGLNVQLVLAFLDKNKNRISAEVRAANKNHELDIPQGTRFIRLGLRLYGSGRAAINCLDFAKRHFEVPNILGRSRYLLLTNHYPSYDDLYRNGFVHSRVSAYREQGVNVDVFRLRKNEPLSYHEFEDIDVITGSQEALDTLLASGDYEHVLVHFLDTEMWAALKGHVDKLKITVWIHGAEIQPWHRRAYNYTNEKELDAAKVTSGDRMEFWRSLLQPMPANLKLVFVSQYFADEVMEDLGLHLPEQSYEIIHNPIDTDIFTYVPKSTEQRKAILSIRPYESRKYANDLSVAAILALRDEPWFDDLEFRLVGDGKLFDETLAPLQGIENVRIERRFLTQGEIAALHREYGVFLTPTRMDAQGVSRDEAMSSGLVPVTNAVAAIPEFVDADCGILAPAESAEGLAAGIAAVYHDPDLFLRLSENAARRVQGQSSKALMIGKELRLFGQDTLPSVDTAVAR